MALTAPVPGQPVDLSYISNIVNSVNDLEKIVNSSKVSSNSGISYSDGSGQTLIPTSNLIFYSSVVQVNDINFTNNTNNIGFSFGNVSFKKTPVVVATAYEVGDSTVPVFCVVNNVSTSGCSVKLYSTQTANVFSGKVSVIAIGEK